MRVGAFQTLGGLLLVPLLPILGAGGEPPARRPHVAVRGVYGGVPSSLMEGGRTLSGSRVNAVWLGERAVTTERVARLRAQGAKVFAEFNTLHRADYLESHPDAAPIGPDGLRAPAPHGWQGICPTHAAYRRGRMDAFRDLLTKHAVDGIWLDYHHAHASWERADPVLPDTCFCPSCLARFEEDTQVRVRGLPVAKAAARLLGEEREAWTRWRCAIFTDWVRAFRAIVDDVRPRALLGTFHCPWSDTERDGALRAKLAIDLRAQMPYLDVFSPMPYHARFGHASDPAWVARQVAWLGTHLGLRGEAKERVRIWPIVQLADWGEPVPFSQVADVLEHATRQPATGVLVFNWGGLGRQPRKVDAMVAFYRAIAE